jgi:hypothetical protein
VWWNHPVNGSDVSRIRSELLLDAVAEAGRTRSYAAGTPKLVAQVLAEIPVFAGLSGRQRRRIAEQAEIAEIKAGTSIMRDGVHGRGGLRAPHRRGTHRARRRPGGRGGVLRIRRETFRRLLEREPTIAVHLLENVGRRLWEAEQEMATRRSTRLGSDW